MKSKMFFSYYQRQLKGLSGLEVAQFFEERCRSEVAAEAARYEAAYKAAEEWVVSAHQSYVKDLVKQLEELEVSYRETARSCSFFAFGRRRSAIASAEACAAMLSIVRSQVGVWGLSPLASSPLSAFLERGERNV